MNILFTKKDLDKKLISKTLGEHFSYDFIDVIKIKPTGIEPFDLKNKSIIFTSINGVEAFFENGFKPNEDFTDKNFNKIYCVGKKTKKKVRHYGFGTFKVQKHAKDLADFIVDNSHGEKFLHFCGNLALNVLDKTLPLQNISYKKIPVYETELLYPIIKKPFNSVVFFSPSGVRSFVKYNDLNDKKLFSIGQTTEKELKKYTKAKIYTSKESNLEDLLNVIAQTKNS
ncbi:MAG: uroporphyrinogen-III synthase [Cruoricaptor ignavus]|nr:uroporphyrinogen-III synthase [Cruoricaptor ignavus]